jgi:predicted cupin superfamily sugar epimerase
MDLKEKIIKQLGLIPLPEEGGFYKESFRSKMSVSIDLEKNDRPVQRTAGTCIYYLITPEDYSALHRVKGEEIFHFYLGDPVEMFRIGDKGGEKVIIGSDLLKGHQLQVVVPSGMWQGTRLSKGGGFALLGTTVFPGFEFCDFELAERSKLLKLYPSLSEDIIRYTRD